MREKFPEICEKARVREGRYGSPPGETYGAFMLRHPGGAYLYVIAADGEEWEGLGIPPPPWEHASVHVHGEERTPTWAEMCWVKDLFWSPEEWVVQYHPAAADYVNRHGTTLHLWKVVGVEFPRPPKELV